MKISLGPILGFRGVTTSGWNVSALIVTDVLSNPPESIVQSGNKNCATQSEAVTSVMEHT